MSEAGKRTTYWSYTPGGKILSETKPDGSVISYEYNIQGEMIRMGSRQFQYDALGRVIRGNGFARKLDPFGNILREELDTGLIITSNYDDWDRPIQRTLPDESLIRYLYEGPFVKSVTRFDNQGNLVYSHNYEKFDPKGNCLFESGLFTTSYTYDKMGRRIYQKSPYFDERLKYDEIGNLIQKGEYRFSYDDASQLISEEGKFQVAYDQHYNCIQTNGEKIAIDDLNQLEDAYYDIKGNLIRVGFIFDEFDQLIQAGTKQFTYDALGRRLSSDSTSYFYIEDEEIGSFEEGQIKELKVVGSKAPIAIEINGKPFAPVVDVQNTIRKLIDWENKDVTYRNSSDPFGRYLSDEIPYAYVGKRYDSFSGLIYFGKRFYDPNTARWLTPDPLGAVDHSNLYQYVFNNPFKYYDPNGESLGGYLFGLGEIFTGGMLIISGGVLEIASGGGYTIGFGIQLGAGMALIEDGWMRATLEAQDLPFSSKPKLAYDDTPEGHWTNGFYVIPSSKEQDNFSYSQMEKKKNQDVKKYKKPKSGISGKEGAKDVPSWAEGNRPYKGESGKDFAKRLMDEQYGPGNYDKGTGTPFNQIKKWGDRSWE